MTDSPIAAMFAKARARAVEDLAFAKRVCQDAQNDYRAARGLDKVAAKGAYHRAVGAVRNVERRMK